MDAIVELRSMLATHLDQTTDKLGLFKSNPAFVTFRGSRWQGRPAPPTQRRLADDREPASRLERYAGEGSHADQSTAQRTDFSLDITGRCTCNGVEALASVRPGTRPFDLIVVGGGSSDASSDPWREAL
jgi:hypothetical protein